MEKLSIIIPVYNSEKTILTTLKSIENNKSYREYKNNLNIIIIDDGSIDKSAAIIKKYIKGKNNFLFIEKENSGAGSTRNVGLENVKDGFVTFLDSDDYVAVDYYEKLYDKIVKEKADVCFSAKKRVDNYGNIINDNDIFLKDGVYNSMEILDCMLTSSPLNNYKKISMSSWRALYNIDIINDFNIRFVSERKYISEDFLFTIDYMVHSKKATFVNNTYHYYCYNGASLTNSYKSDRFEKSLIFIKELKRKLKEYNLINKYENSIYVFLLGYVRVSIKQEIFGSGNDKKDIKNRIKQIVSNKEVVKALNCKYKKTLKNRILDRVLRTKSPSFIIFIFKLNRIKKGD